MDKYDLEASKKPSTGVPKMSSALCEAQSLLREFIAPPVLGESTKARIARAARAVGLTYSRTFTLWYNNARRVDAEEIDLLRAAAIKKAAPKAEEVNAGQDFWTIVREIRSRLEEQRKQNQELIERLERLSQDLG